MGYTKQELTKTKQPPQDAQHPLLQIMAVTLCNLNFADWRRIYERFNWRISDIEKDATQWIKQGWLQGEVVRRYNSSCRMRLRPERWTEVLRQVRLIDIPTLQFLGNPIKDATNRALEAIAVALHACLVANDDGNLPSREHSHTDIEALYINNIDAVNLADKEAIAMADIGNEVLHNIIMTQGITSYFDALLSDATLLPFLVALPEAALVTMFQRFMVSALHGSSPMSREMLDAVFFENDQLPAKLRQQMRDDYVYLVAFPEKGNIDEALAQLSPASREYQIVTALKHLHLGEAPAAFDIFATLLKADGKPDFQEPMLNFAYALAIGLTNSPKAQKAGKEILKSRDCQRSARCYAMNVVLQHFIAKDAEQYLKYHPFSYIQDNLARILAVVFCLHYSIIDADDKEVKAASNIFVSCSSDYLRLLCLDDFKSLAPVAAKLREQTGLESGIMPKVRKVEAWERVITSIIDARKPKPTTNKEKKPAAPRTDLERVAYMVEMGYDYYVQPKLQKSKDGGVTWTRGRNIALKSFMASLEPCMTAQDRKIGSLVHAYNQGWYGNISYELCGEKVIAALVGNQAVFNAKTEQRLDVVEEPVQLIAKPATGGFRITSNVDMSHLGGDIIIQPVGDRQLTVINISKVQRQTLELLKTVNTFPLSSKAQLTEMLEVLSRDFTVMSPLLKNAEQLKRVEACPLIAVQIAPEGGMTYHVALAVKPFAPNPPYQQPAKGVAIVSTTIDGASVQTERNLDAEKRNLSAVRKLMAPFASSEEEDDVWLLDTEECLHMLELLREAGDVAFVEWPQGARLRITRPTITPDMLRLRISSAGQWFEVEGEVSIGEKEKLKMAELLQKLREGVGRYIRLGDNEFVALSEQLRRQLEAIDKMNTSRKGPIRMAAMNGLQLADLESLGAKVQADDAFRRLIDRINEASKMQFPIPTNIHAELRPYQQTGFTWMSRLAHWGAGACLADDMGLGKTLQAITLMQSRAAAGPQLVVMPTSVVLNWQQELLRFAPALTVHLLNPQGADCKTIVSDAAAGDVVLTTYGLLVTEEELLASRQWTTVVLDEAHTIKNRDTQTSHGAMQLRADFRLMLTGTPLQNHLSEIWNLFEFANPGLLGTFQQFAERFIIPVERDHDSDRQRLLKRMLSPFLLRRTKEDVLTELPEKTEITVRVQLSADEQALYDNLRQQAIANLEEGTASPVRALAEITRLRQAACHPRLINPKLKLPSSKTAAFLELAANLRQGGHRALVFSQFTSHLALIREALDNSPLFGKGEWGETSYLYLDGSTPAAKRSSLVREFQTGDTPLFLISLKAGGLGLNLTAADYVIHLDPWWNPAIEDQASDRAHRIGQERPVTVYRLIAQGTIEEKILRLHGTKRSMADALLQEADLFTAVNAADILRLIRENAADI